MTPNGLKDATTNITIIDKWWSRRPMANVGIRTGALSGFIAIDVDPRHGGDDALFELERKHGALPETVESITGSRGRHILFKHPGGVVPNRTAFVNGVDIRGDNGYIVAPPSVHASGREYTWEVDHRPGQVDLAECPEWLLRLIQVGRNAGGRPASDWRARLPRGVEEGQRNTFLTGIIGHLLRRYVDPDLALTAVLSLNRTHCRPPLDDDEVMAVIDSVAFIETKRRIRKGRS